MKYWLLLCLAALSGCASTQIETYEGPSTYQGTGGSKTIVDGIDLWHNGTPPRVYKILGIVRDNRPDAPYHNMSRPHALAKAARNMGGDGVIIMYTEQQFLGNTVFSNTQGQAVAGAVGTIQSNPTGGYNYAGVGAAAYSQQTQSYSAPNFRISVGGAIIKYLN
jgi:hypothetical protein